MTKNTKQVCAVCGMEMSVPKGTKLVCPKCKDLHDARNKKLANNPAYARIFKEILSIEESLRRRGI